MTALAVQPAFNNRILASVPAPEIKRLLPHLSPVDLKLNKTLCDPGETLDSVYFLEEGICSTVVTMKGGNTVEVGITGREGFVGVAAVLGSGQSPNRSYMQVPGHGFKVKAKILREQSEESDGLRLALMRGVQGLLTQMAQTAACNRVHELEERLARWLLMCHERLQTDQIAITHEFLAMMLGTRRSSVTLTAGILQRADLIAYSRGHITLKNYDGLKDVACECYRIVHNEYVRLKLL